MTSFANNNSTSIRLIAVREHRLRDTENIAKGTKRFRAANKQSHEFHFALRLRGLDSSSGQVAG
jgi:hypothetical protein